MIPIPTAYFVAHAGVVVAHVLEDPEHEVEHDPGVDAEPPHRHQQLGNSGQIGAAATERRTREHHLVHAGSMAHDAEDAEERATDEIADDEDEQRLDNAQAENDPERPEDPVDRRDVRAGPDPELLHRRRRAIRCGDLRDAVLVELDGLSQLGALLLHAVPPCRPDDSPRILRLPSDGDNTP